MSLFGSSPDEPAPIAASSKSRSSLFDDEPSTALGAKSSLFADDDAPGASPWGMPTPKKAARGEMTKSLLPASDVPDFYIDIFDDALKTDNAGGKISAGGVAKILSGSSLGTDAQSRILSIITSGGQISDLGRNEFNVLLALIGLAQEHEEITLDSVDERRRNLPLPKLPNASMTSELAAKPPQRLPTPPAAPISAPTSSQKPRNMRKDSLEFPEADPWGSPAMHRGHNHDPSPPKPNGISGRRSNGAHEPIRTTSNFTTASADVSDGTSNQPTEEAQSAPVTEVWGSYDGNTGGAFNPTSSSIIGGGGFGTPSGDGPPPRSTPSRSFGGGRVTTGGVEENVVITLLPEKEGMFMFQHHNYHVASARRGSKVVRRYSDFVWLLDCLQKRYPFRQLPLLPPKRVGVNGNHLAADSTFIEKRRRGLARFSNALVRHPVSDTKTLTCRLLVSLLVG